MIQLVNKNEADEKEKGIETCVIMNQNIPKNWDCKEAGNGETEKEE